MLNSGERKTLWCDIERNTRICESVEVQAMYSLMQKR